MTSRVLKLLVADADWNTHLVFHEYAERSGTKVELASVVSGRRCLEALTDDPPDIAFIAAALPDMTGLEAIGYAHSQGKRCLTAILTGAPSETLLDVIRRLGVYECLLKPISISDVERMIEVWNRLKQPIRALVVDRSPALRQIARRILEDGVFPIEIEEAVDEISAIAACKARRFDLVFVDCTPPWPYGLDVLEAFGVRWPEIRVIMLSGGDDPAKARQAREAGAYGFLTKPFFAADIDREMHRAFGFPLPMPLKPALHPAASD